MIVSYGGLTRLPLVWGLIVIYLLRWRARAMQSFEQARAALVGQVQLRIWHVPDEWEDDVCELIERCRTWGELDLVRDAMRECGW